MSIAKGRVQQKIHSIEQDNLRPDPFGVMEANCVIEEIYDAETLEEKGVTEELASLILSNPGWLFGLVRIIMSGKRLILPFQDSEELIYTVYGNKVLLEGRPALVVYRNLDIQNGFIKLQRASVERHINLQKSANVFNFSGIL